MIQYKLTLFFVLFKTNKFEVSIAYLNKSKCWLWLSVIYSKSIFILLNLKKIPKLINPKYK